MYSLTTHQSCQCQRLRISIPVSDGVLFVRVLDIVRCESDNNYTNLFLSNGNRLLVCKTLKKFEQLLPNHLFSRVHQSHLINIEFIAKYCPGGGGSLTMLDQTHIPVSRSRKEALLGLLCLGR